VSQDIGYKVPTKAQRKLCLIVVDMQNCFFNDDETSKTENRKEIENIAEVIRLFHEKSRDVFVIKYVGETHSICKDMNVIDELGELEPCTYIEKHHMSAFQNTDLPDLIVEKGYDAALICGAYAEHCVMATYWNAFHFELSPYLLSDGVIAYDKKKQKSAEDICMVYTMDDVRENLETAVIDHEYNKSANKYRRKFYYVN